MRVSLSQFMRWLSSHRTFLHPASDFFCRKHDVLEPRVVAYMTQLYFYQTNYRGGGEASGTKPQILTPKSYDNHPCHFYMGAPPPPPPWATNITGTLL